MPWAKELYVPIPLCVNNWFLCCCRMWNRFSKYDNMIIKCIRYMSSLQDSETKELRAIIWSWCKEDSWLTLVNNLLKKDACKYLRLLWITYYSHVVEDGPKKYPCDGFFGVFLFLCTSNYLYFYHHCNIVYLVLHLCDSISHERGITFNIFSFNWRHTASIVKMC